MKWYFYLAILTLLNILCLMRWNHFAKGEKTIAVVLFTTLLSEVASLYMAFRWHNNLPVYHFFNPIQFFLLSLYFNCSIDYFRKRNLGLIIGSLGALLSVMNTLLLQPLNAINSYFLLFEGTAVAIYCLTAMHEILLDEHHLPYRFAHFWITICCLLFWSSTFTGWGLYELLRNDDIVTLYFDKILTTANFVFYTGIGLTLVFYKKLIPTRCA